MSFVMLMEQLLEAPKEGGSGRRANPGLKGLEGRKAPVQSPMANDFIDRVDVIKPPPIPKRAGFSELLGW